MRDTTGADSSRHASGRCATSAWFPWSHFSFLAFDGEGDSHSPAYAERRKAAPCIALLHLVSSVTRMRQPDAPIG